jgi:hypothetical protein
VNDDPFDDGVAVRRLVLGDAHVDRSLDICPLSQRGGSRRALVRSAIVLRGVAARRAFSRELWVERAGQAVSFYEAAFGASIVHRVGDGDDIVAQMAVGDAVFWVASASADMGRFSPQAIGGRRAEPCWWSTTPTPFRSVPFTLARPRRPLSGTSMSGG